MRKDHCMPKPSVTRYVKDRCLLEWPFFPFCEMGPCPDLDPVDPMLPIAARAKSCCTNLCCRRIDIHVDRGGTLGPLVATVS